MCCVKPVENHALTLLFLSLHFWFILFNIIPRHSKKLNRSAEHYLQHQVSNEPVNSVEHLAAILSPGAGGEQKQFKESSYWASSGSQKHGS